MVEITPLRDEERNELAVFLAGWPNETMAAGIWRKRFEVWWAKNPYFTPESCPGWVIREGGRIGGFLGLVPMGFQVNGREIVAYGSTTWRVEPACRHATLGAIARVMRAVKDSMLFVWTGNEGLVRILAALQFVKLPRKPFFHGYQRTLLPLDISGVLFSRQGVTPSRSVAALRRVSKTAFSPYPALVHTWLRWGGRRLVTARVQHADNSFDQLWQRTRGQAAHTNARTSTFLNWHCFSPQYFEKRLYGCYQGSSGPLVGLLIGCSKRARGLRVLDCADIWTDATVPGVLDSLLATLVQEAREEAFDLIELPHYSEAIHRLARSHGFLWHKVNNYFEYYFASKNIRSMMTPDSAYLCGLQGDQYL